MCDISGNQTFKMAYTAKVIFIVPFSLNLKINLHIFLFGDGYVIWLLERY